ncbi:MAG TPA: SRPBCC family protein [Longimicrobiaceae bacterium]|jgi:uncharacterized protein YndB with AHSA1/START domain|nr:SRPBCC family protein [Longimicrobiaceae bacterium]
MADDRIRRSFSVPVAPDEAFRVFTQDFSRWWPAEYTWSGPVLQWIGLEPHPGGACFERGPHGFRCDFGRVLQWHPSERLVLSWQISPSRTPEPDPERASEIEMCFLAEETQGTRVEFEHRGFSRHGSGAEAYRAAMASAQGWDYILERYRRTLA